MGHKTPLPTEGAARQVSHHPARSSDGPDPVYLSSKKAGATGFFAAEAPPPATAHEAHASRPVADGRTLAYPVNTSRSPVNSRLENPRGPAPALCPSYQLVIGSCWSFFDTLKDGFREAAHGAHHSIIRTYDLVVTFPPAPSPSISSRKIHTRRGLLYPRYRASLVSRHSLDAPRRQIPIDHRQVDHRHPHRPPALLAAYRS